MALKQTTMQACHFKPDQWACCRDQGWSFHTVDYVTFLVVDRNTRKSNVVKVHLGQGRYQLSPNCAFCWSRALTVHFKQSLKCVCTSLITSPFCLNECYLQKKACRCLVDFSINDTHVKKGEKMKGMQMHFNNCFKFKGSTSANGIPK